MEEAAAGHDSAMVAVLGFPREQLLEAVRESQSLGTVVIANYNCPGQLVLGGDKAAVQQAAALAKARGARRCVPLRVSGPDVYKRQVLRQATMSIKSVSRWPPSLGA